MIEVKVPIFFFQQCVFHHVGRDITAFISMSTPIRPTVTKKIRI